jgi:RNA polymerase sigma-70 factor (ECF subfamily)
LCLLCFLCSFPSPFSEQSGGETRLCSQKFMREIGERALSQSKDEGERNDRFSALVKRQSRFVFRVAYAVLRNVHDAEEIVQETFLKLYRNDAWERIQRERAFLARTAWRIAVDRLPRTQTETPSEDLIGDSPTPEETAIVEDWNTIIHRLIDALPQHLRQPLALSTVEEMTSHEIGEVMGIPEGTVRTRLMRARQILRQAAEVYGNRKTK